MPKQPATPVDAPRSEVMSESSDAPSASDRVQPEPDDSAPLSEQPRPKEYGGRDGPDPVRYGDWEKNGRCIDF
ncbi:DUF1674 domain-containing protein [Salinisphaera sp. LB1]|uniref:DUF1674 domain-containing protein n=1 Tax=Salinisphaera sp. LB1 TaxID=2183911 RepID=UPI000D706774